jgi:hypothetical protein
VIALSVRFTFHSSPFTLHRSCGAAMPSEPAPASNAFKHWFNEQRYRDLAALLAAEARRFDREHFLRLTLTGLEERELMDRVRQTALACEAALSGTYRDKVHVLRAIAPQVGHTFVGIALCDFVARYGLDDPDFSLAALRELTRYGSAERASLRRRRGTNPATLRPYALGERNAQPASTERRPPSIQRSPRSFQS